MGVEDASNGAVFSSHSLWSGVRIAVLQGWIGVCLYVGGGLVGGFCLLAAFDLLAVYGRYAS